VIYFLLPRPDYEKHAELPEKEHEVCKEQQWERNRLAYETLNADIRDRGEGTILSGTIFVTASILILVQSVSSGLVGGYWMRFAVAIGAIVIYAAWLFGIQYTTQRIDKLTYARLHRLEEAMRIEAHNYVRKHWMNGLPSQVRYYVWGIILLLLTIGGGLVLCLADC